MNNRKQKPFDSLYMLFLLGKILKAEGLEKAVLVKMAMEELEKVK